jgi:hypothetical protein
MTLLRARIRRDGNGWMIEYVVHGRS